MPIKQTFSIQSLTGVYQSAIIFQSIIDYHMVPQINGL